MTGTDTKLEVYVLQFEAIVPGGARVRPPALTRHGCWVLRHEGSGALVRAFRRDLSKAECTTKAASLMREFFDRCRQSSELKVRRLDGSFGPARTYPSAADPIGSRG